jgi:integrase/recombinase XerD
MQRKFILPKGLKLRGNTYQINFTVNGKRYRISTGKQTENEAIEFYNDFIKQAENPHANKGDFLFNQVALMYLDNIETSNKIEETTIKKYKFQIKELKEFFGDRYLSEITRPLIKQFFDMKIRTGCSQEHMRRLLLFLGNMFNFCIDMEITERNPIHNWQFVSGLPKGGKRVAFLTLDEANKVIACSNPYLQRFIIVLLETGMRLNEALQLKHNDILLKEIKTKNEYGEDRVVNYPYIFVRAEYTKTKKNRIIPLTELAKEQIKLQKTEFPFQTFIFTDRNGRAYRSTPMGALRNAFRRAGFKKERQMFHLFRHTFASWSLQGISLSGNIPPKSIKIIADILGHSNTRITEEVYAKHDDTSLIKGFLNIIN